MPFRAQGQSGARGVSGKAGQDSGTRLALGGTQPALGTMGRMLAWYESDEGQWYRLWLGTEYMWTALASSRRRSGLENRSTRRRMKRATALLAQALQRAAPKEQAEPSAALHGIKGTWLCFLKWELVILRVGAPRCALCCCRTCHQALRMLVCSPLL